MMKGNIVRWHGDIYIVGDVKDSYDKGKHQFDSCVLLSSTHSNCSSHPSRTWPDDPKKRIDSVEVVADNLQEFIHNMMDNAIDQMVGVSNESD